MVYKASLTKNRGNMHGKPKKNQHANVGPTFCWMILVTKKVQAATEIVGRGASPTSETLDISSRD